VGPTWVEGKFKLMSVDRREQKIRGAKWRKRRRRKSSTQYWKISCKASLEHDFDCCCCERR
jgi:hypothetical protein